MEGTTDPLEEPVGSELGQAVLHPLWMELQETAMKQLDEVSIEDLCTRARAAGVQCNASELFDFMI
jgi:Rrf2 family transcriptional regulator, iron-sulfur cluster assembly transcription factor